MPLFTCPKCRETVRILDQQRGLKVGCPHCGRRFRAGVEPVPYPVTLEIDEPPLVTAVPARPAGPNLANIGKTAGLIAGLSVFTAAAIGIGILIVRKPQPKPVASEPVAADPQAAQRAERERAEMARAAAERAKALAREKEERKYRDEFAAFRKAMLSWVRSGRSVTRLLRAAPSPPILHEEIRRAANRLEEAGKFAAAHVENGRDGPTAKPSTTAQ